MNTHHSGIIITIIATILALIVLNSSFKKPEPRIANDPIPAVVSTRGPLIARPPPTPLQPQVSRSSADEVEAKQILLKWAPNATEEQIAAVQEGAMSMRTRRDDQAEMFEASKKHEEELRLSMLDPILQNHMSNLIASTWQMFHLSVSNQNAIMYQSLGEMLEKHGLPREGLMDQIWESVNPPGKETWER